MVMLQFLEVGFNVIRPDPVSSNKTSSLSEMPGSRRKFRSV